MHSSELDAVFDYNADACPDFTDGDCLFEVVGGKIGNSKAGQPMMTLHIKITDVNSQSEVTHEHIVANTLWKLKSLLNGAGQPGMFNKLPRAKLRDYIGLNGKCKTKLEKSPEFPDKHVISGYVLKDSEINSIKSESPVVSAEPFIEDEIPF